MRRSERHHLKENPLAIAIAQLQVYFSEWSTGLALGLALVVGTVLAYGGYTWWTERTASRAGTLLAEALVLADAPVIPAPAPPPPAPPLDAADDAETEPPPPPAEFVQPPGSYPSVGAKLTAALPGLLEAADAYPSTQAGITARYRAATTLAALSRYDEAAEQYEQVIARDGTGVYSRMAALGLANTQILLGAHDEAISLLEQSSIQEGEAELPIDGVLMNLARAYAAAGRAGDARATLQRVLDEFPTSIYTENATQELGVLLSEG